MLYAARARAATTRSWDRFCENRKNDGMRRQDKRARPLCRQRQGRQLQGRQLQGRQKRRIRSRAGGARSLRQLGKGSFIFCESRGSVHVEPALVTGSSPAALLGCFGCSGVMAVKASWLQLRGLHFRWLHCPSLQCRTGGRCGPGAGVGDRRPCGVRPSDATPAAGGAGKAEQRRHRGDENEFGRPFPHARSSPALEGDVRTKHWVACNERLMDRGAWDVPDAVETRARIEKNAAHSKTPRSRGHCRTAAITSIHRITSNVQARLPRTETAVSSVAGCTVILWSTRCRVTSSLDGQRIGPHRPKFVIIPQEPARG
jgi:hypothetical protein